MGDGARSALSLAGNQPGFYRYFWGYYVPAVTYSLVQGGYVGAGNINEDPEFVDSANDDLQLASDSPCIDAGDNTVPGMPAVDLDGKPRFIDGNGDMSALVDMGAYEYGDIGECDFNDDLDVDGTDLAAFIDNPAGYTPADFAEDFGRTDCPLYSYTP